MMEETITFILPVTSQPRYHKRIGAFTEKGYNCKIFSFERDYFKGKRDEMSYTSLGRISHGSYFKRIKVLISAVYKLRSKKDTIKNSKCIYVFGFDNLILITLIKFFLKIKRPIVYEVAD